MVHAKGQNTNRKGRANVDRDKLFYWWVEAGRNAEQAAKKHQVHPATMHYHVRAGGFQQRFIDEFGPMRDYAVELAALALASQLDQVTQVMVAMVKDESMKEQDRINAARVVFDAYTKLQQGTRDRKKKISLQSAKQMVVEEHRRELERVTDAEFREVKQLESGLEGEVTHTVSTFVEEATIKGEVDTLSNSKDDAVGVHPLTSPTEQPSHAPLRVDAAALEASITRFIEKNISDVEESRTRSSKVQSS